MSVGNYNTFCLGKSDMSQHTLESAQSEDKTLDVMRETYKTGLEEIDRQRESRLRPLVGEPPELELKALPENICSMPF